MVQALPQYSEQIDKLSLHVEVSFSFMGGDIVWLNDSSLPILYFVNLIFHSKVMSALAVFSTVWSAENCATLSFLSS